MITTMNTCKYPEIKFIGSVDLQSVSNKNKKNYKNKNIFLPTDPNFFQEVTGNTHVIFLGLIFHTFNWLIGLNYLFLIFFFNA